MWKPGVSGRSARTALWCAWALAASAGGCGGTTGREGAPTPTMDATVSDGDDAAGDDDDAESGPSSGNDAGLAPAADTGAFDVVIQYADRVLPDVSVAPTPEAGADVSVGVIDAGNVLNSPCLLNNSVLGADGGPSNTLSADGGPPLGPDGGPVPAVTPVGCSATEQLFANLSVDCYACLVNFSCLDDLAFGDALHECEDLSGNAVGGGASGTSLETLCLQALSCVLGSGCWVPDVAGCYCGTLAGAMCATSMMPGDGTCKTQEADGVGHFDTDPASVVSPLLALKATASGMADAILACAFNNNCGPVCPH